MKGGGGLIFSKVGTGSDWNGVWFFGGSGGGPVAFPSFLARLGLPGRGSPMLAAPFDSLLHQHVGNPLYEHTELFTAASHGRVDDCSKLLEQKVDVDAVDPVRLLLVCCMEWDRHLTLPYWQYGGTALFQAVVNGHKRVVKLLLEAGANPDIPGPVSHAPARAPATTPPTHGGRGQEKKPPLNVAITGKQEDIADLLLVHRAEVNVFDQVHIMAARVYVWFRV